MARHILVVLTNAKDGRNEDFNDWYDETHLRDVLEIDGFVGAQRFKLSGAQMADACPYEYLAIYEVETDDLQKTLDALNAGVAGGMVVSDALDMANLATWAYAPAGERITA